MNSSDKEEDGEQIVAEVAEQQVILALAESVDKVSFDDAFALLVRVYAPMLMLKLLKMLHNSEIASEVLQDTLMSAAQSLSGFSEERIRSLKLKSWLYTITIHCADKTLRKIARTSGHISLEGEAFHGEFFERLEVSSYERPETALDALETRERVLEAIHELPKQFQETAFLYFFEECSITDISAKLNLPVNTVKSHIHRSRVQLKVALKTLVD